jgi:hypothetical protein
MLAVGLKDIIMTKLLLENKARVTSRDSFSKTALIYAIENG